MTQTRIIEISEDGKTLAVERGFLIVRENNIEIGKIPLDSILSVVCTCLYATITTGTIEKLAQNGIPLIICTRKTKVPTSIIIPLECNYRQADVIQAQADATLPQRKRIWQKIVSAKLLQQSSVLEYFNKIDVSKRLKTYSQLVKSGDSDNLEGQGAAYYWKALMGDTFRRDKNAEDSNILFNYAYTILRAATLRALCSAGLHPSLGVHHKTSTNKCRLADDLMEPFRPLFDIEVKTIIHDSGEKLTNNAKRILCSVLEKRYLHNGQISAVKQIITETAIAPTKYYLHEVSEFNLCPIKIKNLKQEYLL